MGGEKRALFGELVYPLGSPPHGRGKAEPFKSLLIAVGITPARAGKRSGKSASDNVPRDHPRMGGEKTKSIHPYPVLDGSPPHGRGKVSGISAASIWPRITPA